MTQGPQEASAHGMKARGARRGRRPVLGGFTFARAASPRMPNAYERGRNAKNCARDASPFARRALWTASARATLPLPLRRFAAQFAIMGTFFQAGVWRNWQTQRT